MSKLANSRQIDDGTRLRFLPIAPGRGRDITLDPYLDELLDLFETAIRMHDRLLEAERHAAAADLKHFVAALGPMAAVRFQMELIREKRDAQSAAWTPIRLF